MAYLIEKNVPVPADGRRGPEPKYPFRSMEVGDSFVVPAGEAKFSKRSADGRPVSRVSVATSGAGKRLGRRFVTRTNPDGSVRVWRTA